MDACGGTGSLGVGDIDKLRVVMLQACIGERVLRQPVVMPEPLKTGKELALVILSSRKVAVADFHASLAEDVLQHQRVRHRYLRTPFLLFPKFLGLLPVAVMGRLHAFPLFRLSDDVERIVHVALHGIYQAGGLLQFLRPVFHHAPAFGRQLRRQPELRHLQAGGYLGNKALVAQGVTRRCLAAVHHHAFP